MSNEMNIEINDRVRVISNCKSKYRIGVVVSAHSIDPYCRVKLESLSGFDKRTATFSKRSLERISNEDSDRNKDSGRNKEKQKVTALFFVDMDDAIKVAEGNETWVSDPPVVVVNGNSIEHCVNEFNHRVYDKWEDYECVLCGGVVYPLKRGLILTEDYYETY